MVRLTRIYTRTGDDGTTGLADGTRRSKSDFRLTAYGTVDEANALIGLALETEPIADEAVDNEIRDVLRHVQNDLFDLGADLATPPGEGEALRVQAQQVEWLEKRIDHFNGPLPPLESFVLPGGCPLAAALHVARTVCRRAERETVALAERETIGDQVLTYLNRCSDLLFVLARVANGGGEGDVPWIPGANR